jgi:hypothetical protein
VEPLGVGEILPPLHFDLEVEFPGNFALNSGSCLGTLPGSPLTINIRQVLADGTDNGIVGSITINPDGSRSRSTLDGLPLLCPIGSNLIPVAPVAPSVASVVVETLIGNFPEPEDDEDDTP